MITTFTIVGSVAIYVTVAMGTYVLAYAPFYREHLALHTAQQCRNACRCRRVERVYFPIHHYTSPDDPVWEEERQQAEWAEAVDEEGRDQIRAEESALFARHRALDWAVFWPIVFTYQGLAYALTHLRDGIVWGVTNLSAHPLQAVQRFAERPIRNEARRAALQAEHEATLARLNHDMEEGS